MSWKKAVLAIGILTFALLVNHYSPSKKVAHEVSEVAEDVIKAETGVNIDIDGMECGDDE